MSYLPENFKFKYSWRNYQQKFLDNFQGHIHDDHLHVVAPPGSGKTILGIEMIGRINKRTLVLSPTLTIRNQWKDRLFQYFLKDSKFKQYSFDIEEPSMVTFTTYQSLHALEKRMISEQEGSLAAFFKEEGIQVIVLDEAHHLKNEWWRSLFALKEINDVVIIALTATPPYDSTQAELKKYFDLCGPIDDEIAVPDLIKEGDLCPHQDFVYLSTPTKAEIDHIIKYRKEVLAYTMNLEKDADFINLLLSHRFYTSTEQHLEEIYEKPQYFSSLLIFLNASGYQLDKKKVKILGLDVKKTEIPNATNEWIQLLLQNLLVDDRKALIVHEDQLKSIEKGLRKIGAYRSSSVDLIGSANFFRKLAESPGKLDAIQEIVQQEYAHLGNELGCVILADYIRKEYLDFKVDADQSLDKLGIVPIFQRLRIEFQAKETIAVLTGSLVIVHERCQPSLQEKMAFSDLSFEPLKIAPEYSTVKLGSKARGGIVKAMTALFSEGKIKVLIGTKSLLGEGWDAPSINTLVLASYVGSFVLSNQMRGRAIRTEKDNPNKTGNIWHLASIDTTIETGGYDIGKLTRRFDAFTGVSLKGIPYIRNGISRLDLPLSYNSEIDFEHLNKETFKVARQRSELIRRWTSAIEKGDVLINELTYAYQGEEPFKRQRRLYYLDAVKYVFFQLGLSLTYFLFEFILKNMHVVLGKGLLNFLYTLLLALVLGFLPRTYKAVRLYVMFGRMDKIIHKMAYTVFYAMCDLAMIKTPENELTLEIERSIEGSVMCRLRGATTHENNQFLNGLQEILEPVENPRYLIVKAGWLRRKLGLGNYYAVPTIFGKKKEMAQLFFNHWKKHVGRSEMIFTRNKLGRKILLKARLTHIRHELEEQTKKSISWK
ncbi:DEAD/DEAH box helicase family protein [Sungkyunkwania multivorans]|uniref:DEAD/DEAH box helicase family protein n=1 Tax=Sungkyunkwania multivorans TaxID=1173618 RepID=A0ABW3CYY8_9FLAO